MGRLERGRGNSSECGDSAFGQVLNEMRKARIVGDAIAFGQSECLPVNINLELSREHVDTLLATVGDRPAAVVEVSRYIEDEYFEAALEIGRDELVNQVVVRDYEPLPLVLAHDHLRLGSWAREEATHRQVECSGELGQRDERGVAKSALHLTYAPGADARARGQLLDRVASGPSDL